MRRDMGILAGVSATAIALAVVAQTGIYRSGAEVPPVAAPEPKVAAEGGPAVVPEAAPAPDPQQAALAVRETEIDRLTALLAEREASYATAETALTERDGEVTRLTALLAERDGELATLRATLETLRTQAAFDARLTALKGDPAMVRIEPARMEVQAVAATLETAGPVGADVPATSGDPLTAVHFDKASARLSPGGQAHAAAAAVTLADMKIARVKVVGHTDRVGDPARNRVLAAARAQAVADFLIAAGLPAEMIEIDGMGEAEAPVATDDGVAEPLNRCAEIRVVPL
ncbi:OmpA family protein [Amaricoccus sp.]|uniref:OmpA family protein n=1 Tax=Amaricoccus sp. TaxID=1872485 RepID=UPI00260D4EAB|nr:OmpA family protein [uncultured Amaricoccus sp.]